MGKYIQENFTENDQQNKSSAVEYISRIQITVSLDLTPCSKTDK
jgi:hypothetical protein